MDFDVGILDGEAASSCLDLVLLEKSTRLMVDLSGKLGRSLSILASAWVAGRCVPAATLTGSLENLG